jgi:alpha-amylase
MEGQVEDLKISEDGEIIVVNRGNKGAAIINFALEENVVELPTALPDGKYTDVVYGNVFTVEGGVLRGMAAPEKTYILSR